ncbi:hypothetical protein SOVF_019780 [Spinacia oleracea]|nr:hypothetical protein SOVF_019780 [Spinacia oleracea]
MTPYVAKPQPVTPAAASWLPAIVEKILHRKSRTRHLHCYIFCPQTKAHI